MANMAPPIAPHRHAINAFVERHQLAWDLVMAGLALAFVALSVVEDHVPPAFYETWLAPVEVAITLLFVAEFSMRFYAAESRLGYLRRHWIDLLALLPAVRALRFLRAFRVFRMLEVLQGLRLLRLGALVRLLAEFERAGHRVRWIARHNGVHVFLTLAAGITLIGGALVYELEHSTNLEYHDFGNAIWWAFATMATVGYGNGPETWQGRVIAAVIMVVGIGCFGLMTATVTTFFLERTSGASSPQASPNELRALLEEVSARLERVERELAQARREQARSWAGALPVETSTASAEERDALPLAVPVAVSRRDGEVPPIQ